MLLKIRWLQAGTHFAQDFLMKIDPLKGSNMPTKKNLSNLLTVTQAARLLGLTRQTIWEAVKKGRIKSQRVGHVSLIPRSSLQQYKSSRKPGRPRKRNKKNS